jgi:hypothetical protein
LKLLAKQIPLADSRPALEHGLQGDVPRASPTPEAVMMP